MHHALSTHTHTHTHTQFQHSFFLVLVISGAHEPPKAAKERVSAHSSTATRVGQIMLNFFAHYAIPLCSKLYLLCLKLCPNFAHYAPTMPTAQYYMVGVQIIVMLSTTIKLQHERKFNIVHKTLGLLIMER